MESVEPVLVKDPKLSDWAGQHNSHCYVHLEINFNSFLTQKFQGLTQQADLKNHGLIIQKIDHHKARQKERTFEVNITHYINLALAAMPKLE